MMKVVTVVGARPQFVKAATVSRAFKNGGKVDELIVHTGQHFDKNMSDVFFEEMAIPKPAYHLEINSMGHGAMTGRMLEKIEEVLIKEKPDLLLVYGDTNSTLAGALAAKKIHIEVGHVEAGLRSFNMRMPEEVNRILTDRISDHLFCPTDAAVANLKREGYDQIDAKIHRTGDVMYDAALFYAQHSAAKSTIVQRLGLEGDFALATIHRAENTDDPQRLRGIVEALNEVHGTYRVICPIHPRTRKVLEKSGLSVAFEMIDPVGYFDIIELLKASNLVFTDSGGLQKEAFFFQSPCITLRDQTEWIELVDHGYNQLAGADKNKILKSFEAMRQQNLNFDMDLYGDGHAADVIAEIISG